SPPPNPTYILCPVEPVLRTVNQEEPDYVYTPASLVLFNDVTTAIQAVTAQIDAAISELGSSGSGLLTRFQRGSTIYPLIETLGASTDLVDLKAKAKSGDDVDQQLDVLTQGVAALRANTIGTQIAGLKSEQRVLSEAAITAEALIEFDQVKYNEALATRAKLTVDYETFRRELFAACMSQISAGSRPVDGSVPVYHRSSITAVLPRSMGAGAARRPEDHTSPVCGLWTTPSDARANRRAKAFA
ncbi:hypothetical protein QEN44_21955, partial [Gordonia alkanivorans]|nr:hypothetical protein [Gordonia alkanivorans]